MGVRLFVVYACMGQGVGAQGDGVFVGMEDGGWNWWFDGYWFHVN